ncbi:hypothetical protein EW146_g10205, partial [Bondarzewia mesenterica]
MEIVGDKFYKPVSLGDMENEIYERLGSHPRIVPVSTTDAVEGFLVLQYQTNGSVLEYIMTHLTPFELHLRWIIQLAEGIAYIHSKNVVWCDCKLPNVLVTADLNIVLCDFGGSSIDGCPAGVGPPIFYILPSQLDTSTWRYPPNQDRFAFGTCTFLLLARRWPLCSKRLEDEVTWEEMRQVEHKYRQGEFDALSPEAYPELAQVVQKCWRDEYTSTEDMLRDIREGCATTLKKYEQADATERAQLYGDILSGTVQKAPEELRGSG